MQNLFVHELDEAIHSMEAQQSFKQFGIKAESLASKFTSYAAKASTEEKKILIERLTDAFLKRAKKIKTYDDACNPDIRIAISAISALGNALKPHLDDTDKSALGAILREEAKVIYKNYGASWGGAYREAAYTMENMF